MAVKSYRILFTTNSLAVRGGSELFVRDLAIALQRRGHRPVAHSTVLGKVADELRCNAVPVIDDLRALTVPPDVIHGQHHIDVAAAALAFPKVPIVFVCHGWLPWEEMPLSLPTIQRYVAISDLTRESLLTTAGIAAERVNLVPNFVDTDRFSQVRNVPTKPKKALVFGNGWKHDHPHVTAIADACRATGITQIDHAGFSLGAIIERPEEALPNYDLVFAVGRAAIEAMSVGCAVIVADTHGLGGLVTPENLTELQQANFAYAKTTGHPLTKTTVASEISKFNLAAVEAVTRRVRAEASLAARIRVWEELYATATAAPLVPTEMLLSDASAYLRKLKATIVNVVQTRHAKIETLDQAVTARDTRIETLDHAVTARDAKIETLDQAVTARDARIETLDQAVTAREARIRTLDQALAERDKMIESFLLSRSWRYTAPLRWVHRLIGKNGPHP